MDTKKLQIESLILVALAENFNSQNGSKSDADKLRLATKRMLDEINASEETRKHWNDFTENFIIEDYLKENHLSYNSAIRNDVGELLGIGDLIYKQNKSLNEQLEETRQTGLDSIKIAEDLSKKLKKYESRVEELQEQLANSESQHTITLEKLRFVTDQPELNEIGIMTSETKRMAWSLNTFTEATPKSSLLKCLEEIEEIEENITAGKKDAIEYADAIMCLFDSAGRDGITALEIQKAYAEKVEINTKRIWVKNPDNTYSHVKVKGLKF